jgi:nucleoside-diphosphate-sugar epimerase
MKKIIITGATGMIGSSLVKHALEQDIEVLCIIRKDTNRFDNIPKSEKIKVVFSGLSEYASLYISEKYDVFFHLAWDKTFGSSRDDVDIQENNIRYSLDAVRLAHRLGCSVFVGAGSQAEYGIVSEPLRSDTPVNPQSGYGIAKYTAGKLSKLLCAQLGLRCNWLRILSVFGPLDGSHTLIMYTINELRADHSPEFTKCEQIWDYLYSDDAARAFLAVGNKGTDGMAYPLGSGDRRRLSEYLESLRDIVNPTGILQFGKKEYYPYQPMFLGADISELTADTGWKPEISFEKGIKMMVDPPNTDRIVS